MFNGKKIAQLEAKIRYLEARVDRHNQRLGEGEAYSYAPRSLREAMNGNLSVKVTLKQAVQAIEKYLGVTIEVQTEQKQILCKPIPKKAKA